MIFYFLKCVKNLSLIYLRPGLQQRQIITCIATREINSIVDQVILTVPRHQIFYHDNKRCMLMRCFYKWLMISRRFAEIFSGFDLLNSSLLESHFEFRSISGPVNGYITSDLLKQIEAVTTKNFKHYDIVNFSIHI